jgi:hypothetical protein
MSAFGDLVKQQIEALPAVMEKAGFRRTSRRQNPRWTKADDEKLRRAYDAGGRQACIKAFAAKRTPGAVGNRCNKLRLVGTPHVSIGRLEWRIQCAREKLQNLEAELARRLERRSGS